ncbi:MAG: hypothetical protein U5J82_13685 [Desulfobacterales bacterium]|nr:hypothetical protein [Desulfobacterales bacterium]
MIPTFFFGVGVFALGLKRFLNDIHQNALLEGKTDKQTIEPVGFAQAFIRILPTIFKHRQFSECTENNERSTAHMMVFFGFIGLFIVTNIFFVALYGSSRSRGPISQINPVKWLANVSGVALVIGSLLMIKSRLDKKEQISSYKDWSLLGLVLGLGLTGMLTEMTRLAGFGGVSYTLYFIHLLFIWALFAYTPFSKLAHLVYRTVAMTYVEYANRK